MSALWSTAVREYTSKTLISVRAETPLSEVQQLLEEREISAVPVLDAGGKLQGIVSSTDLLRVARLEVSLTGFPTSILFPSPPKCARDVMRNHVVAIDEDAELHEAARLMIRHHVHRVVVLRGGRPVSILSTRDAMRAVLFHHIETPLEQVMTTPVETIDLGAPIHDAIDRLTDANIRGLVVVDGEWPVGVFTHTEAIKARSLPREMLARPVEQVMSYETICLDVATPLYRVAGHAMQMRVRRILAVHGRRLRGVVTGFDLVRVMTTPP
jgi:predicted transcriptional regulator